MRLGINLPGPFSVSVGSNSRSNDDDSGVITALGCGILIVYFLVAYWYVTVPFAIFVLVVRQCLRARRSKKLVAGTRPKK
jgi:threonine/homoserine/homoserine lactone efflux protein